MHAHRVALGLTVALAPAFVFAGAAVATDTPAAAFAAAWAAVDDYTATITVHETDGKSVQDRVYRYA